MHKYIITTVIALIWLVSNSSQALAQQTQFGINIEPSVYYSADGLYTDLMMHATGWWTNPSTNIPLNQYGYPSYPAPNGQWATTLFYFDGYPSGDYQFYCEGDFNIDFRGAVGNNFVPGTMQKVGNVTTGLVHYNVTPPQYGNLGSYPTTTTLIDVMPTGPNPINNMHLIAPGYAAYPNNPKFTNLYLQAVAPFKCLRMMDWMGTNGSTVSSWASRPNPDYFGDGNQNDAYERFIDLANQTNADLWVNIPIYATDDYITNFAQLLASRLKPGLHVYYEYSNEEWNWGFTQWQVVENWDQTNPALTSNAAWARHGQEMAFLIVHAANLMQPILGGMGRPILGGQFGGGYDTDGLAWIQQTYGPPSSVIFGIAEAPYFGPSSADPPPTDVDSLMTSMNDNINSSVLQGIQHGVALANQYGIKYCCYESGQGLASSDPNTFALYQAAQYDPRMATLYTNYANIMANNGVYLCNFFTGFGQHDSQWGFWAALTDIRFVTNPPPKYAAEAAAANAGGSNLPPGSGNGGGGSGGGAGGGAGGGDSKHSPVLPHHGTMPTKSKIGMPISGHTKWMPINGHPNRTMPTKSHSAGSTSNTKSGP